MVGKYRFKIEGVITALLTPLTSRGEVKEDAFEQLIDFQIKSGISGFFPLGTFGEGPKLRLEVRKKAAEIALEKTKGRVPVIVHVGTQDTSMCIELARHAKEIGADAIGAVGPFYYKPDLQGLIQHYKRIGEAVDLPLFIYNCVGRQGYNIAPDNFGKIAKSVPQVVGIKDTSYSIPQLQELVSKFGENYTIIGAGDTLIYAAFMTGAPAFISGISNVFPRLTIDIYEAVKRGNYEKARELQFELNKLRAILKKGPTITPYKEALKILQGIDLGTVSSPLRPMTKREIEELKSELRELGILT